MWIGRADASLVGDTVTIDHLFPDNATSLNGDGWPASVVVEAGIGDMATFYFGYPYAYNVNVEASSIIVDYNHLQGAADTWPDNCFLFSCEFGAVVTFDGLSVSNLNDNLVFSPVPLPSAIYLLGSGLVGLIGVTRRKVTA
jgi:hypothetical protein